MAGERSNGHVFRYPVVVEIMVQKEAVTPDSFGIFTASIVEHEPEINEIKAGWDNGKVRLLDPVERGWEIIKETVELEPIVDPVPYQEAP